MLPDKLLALARKATALQLKDLDQPLAIAVGGVQAQMHGTGRMFIYIFEAYRREIGKRADVIWRNLHRAHNSMGAPYSDRLRSDLGEETRARLDDVMSDLAPRFEKAMQGAPVSPKERSWNAKLGDIRDHELARYETEIDHYVATLETAKERGAQAGASYVVHGNVGAIVSGAGASATVVQNIGTDQRDALLKALDLVRQAISKAPEVVENDRRELLELVDEAGAEIGKEKPNSMRLGFALQALAAAVQGVASGPAAYDVLRSAAAAIGVSL